MKKLIHGYLSIRFILNKEHVLLISKEKDIVVHRYFLLREMNKVFNLTEKQCKWYLKSWMLKQNKGFDFNEFWNFNFDVFPMLTFSKNARMISSELVEVRPLGPPTCFNYMIGVDPCYEGRDVATEVMVLMNDGISVLNSTQFVGVSSRQDFFGNQD